MDTRMIYATLISTMAIFLISCDREAKKPEHDAETAHKTEQSVTTPKTESRALEEPAKIPDTEPQKSMSIEPSHPAPPPGSPENQKIQNPIVPPAGSAPFPPGEEKPPEDGHKRD